MAKDSARKNEPKGFVENSPFPVFDPAEFTKISSRNLEVATRAARAYFDGATRLNQEMTGFVNARVKKDIESAQSFMTSKTSEEAFHAQATFVEEAIRDYADEASKMLHIAADLAKETLGPVEERTEEMLHSLDERAEPPKAAE